MSTWTVRKDSMKRHCKIKKKFHRNLKTKEIMHAGYKHAKRVWQDFEIQNMGEYHFMCAG